jgi:transposase
MQGAKEVELNNGQTSASSETTRAKRATPRQRIPIAEKRRIVKEMLNSGKPVKSIAQAHGLRANLLFKWRRMYQEGRLGAVKAEPALLPVRIVESQPLAPAEHIEKRHRGDIHIEFAQARIRIESGADPALVRAALEYLSR